MKEEALEIIQRKFDNNDGMFIIAQLISKGLQNQKNLLNLTNLDRKIKLKYMERTWEFTRTCSMM